MKVLFVVARLFMKEPLGVMQLISICRKHGHQVRLMNLRRTSLLQEVRGWQPDVVAYNCLSADIDLFKASDQQLQSLIDPPHKKICRIMGGAHPTFCPQVIDEMNLDAICIGEGDRALPLLLDRLKKGEGFTDIPNIALNSSGEAKRELVHNLDELPFVDREEFFRIAPYYRWSGLRSFNASRGCPYQCSYCFNVGYNTLFRGCGKIVRRRSVDHLMAEIEHVMREFAPVKLIRFSDDTFVHQMDDWLLEFCQQYRRRVPIPFYCLMRSNTLTEQIAAMLANAGCYSISMALEAGDEGVRNGILHRNLSDRTVIDSFRIAQKYRIKTYANVIMGIPGTTLAHDLHSLEVSRSIKPSVSTFGICTPYRGTPIWRHAVDLGILDPQKEMNRGFAATSALKNYTMAERRLMERICCFGTMFCAAAKPLLPLMRLLIMRGWHLKIVLYMGRLFMRYRIAVKIFPQAIPRSPIALFYIVRDSLQMGNTNG